MTQEPTPLVTVLPCDREAAARLFRRYNGSGSSIEGAILSGAYDHDERVQIVARHRLAALEEGREQAAGLAEMGDWDSWSALATAIRALSNKGGRDGE